MSLPGDPRTRAGLVVAAVLVGMGVVAYAIERVAPSPHGPDSSSYATSPGGLAAYASVLDRAGHRVRRVRRPIARDAPDTGETLVVLDPDVVEPKEARAIGAWVRAGGRLVAGGARDASWLEEVMRDPPVWSGTATGRARTLVPVAETAGVSTVITVGGGWEKVGGALPAIGPADAPLLVVARRGRGSVALLSDASPLQNRFLGQADDAALGLALPGGRGRAVAFLETVHGYGASRGLGGLPARVRWALLGLALAGLAAVWSAGRRLGPPEDAERPLPPPRAEYVEALAASLVRAAPRDELEALAADAAASARARPAAPPAPAWPASATAPPAPATLWSGHASRTENEART